MSLSRTEPAILAANRRHRSSQSSSLSSDPLGIGLVASLARPGGNVTGLSIQGTDIAGKRLELLRELVPGLRRLAILANPGNPAAVLEMGEVQAAARTLGLDVAHSKSGKRRTLRPRSMHSRAAREALYVVLDPL